MSAEENMKLMKTLDDAWNSQDWETFANRHTDDRGRTMAWSTTNRRDRCT